MAVRAEIIFKSIHEEEPKIESYVVSRDVLFIVNGNIYRGHYHSNGCFYCSDQRTMGYTKKAKWNSPDIDKYCQEVTYWNYADSYKIDLL